MPRRSDTPGPKPQTRARAAPGTVNPPRGLSKEARRLWRQLAPELAASKLLAPADAMTLGIACEVGAFLQDAAAALHADGLTTTDAAHKDTERRSPQWVVFQQAASTWLAYAGHLGLSPKARQALVDQGGASAGDAFDAYMRAYAESRKVSEKAVADEW